MPGPVSATEFSDLLAAARSGDSAALGSLFADARGYLLRVAGGELSPALRAKGSGSDLVQESFLEAQRLLDRFTGSNAGEFRAWLRSVLLNKLSDFHRRYQRSHKRQAGRELAADQAAVATVATPATTPSGAAHRAEEAAAVAQAMAQLPSDYQLVIRLRTWEGLSFAEVGARLDRTEAAARMLWGRAVDRLRVELGGNA
jgi:RNA polymerase sigma-70 factor (ECF subfamily)